jgi:protein TonB
MMQSHFIVAQKEKDKIINLSLSQFIPEVIEEAPKEIEEPKVEEEPEPEEVEPEPEKIEPKVVELEPVPPEPVVKEEPVVEPIVVKKEKKPEPKKVVKKKKPIKKKKKIVKKKKKQRNKKAKKHKTKSKSSQRASSRRATSRRVDVNKKSRFLAKIRAKINRAKSYPRIAQRRGMQGRVKVRFTILKNGNVGHISISGPKVFQNSAKAAVKKAFPINTRNAPLSLPTSVNLTLRYQLR